jgi:hypothetical protein
MCPDSVWLLESIIAASVVDAPELVGPIPNKRPRGVDVRSSAI